MKKKLALVLVGLMASATLTGCNKYVKLCDYTGVEATKVTFEVTDEEVQEEIEYSLYDYVTYDEITNRGVEIGDYANITYTATIDGEENADYSGDGEEVLVGEGWLYPELEDALVGMKNGEEKEVELELTADYADEEYVGKKAIFKVVVNSISVENMPEYDLEFVKANTDYDTIEDYEASVKESLVQSKEEEYKYVAVEEIFAYLIENSEFDGYPNELYEKCEKMYNSNNEFYASMYGMTVEEFLEMYGIDEKTKKQEIEASVNYELVIREIAKKEKIECTDEEVTKYIEEIYAEYGYESTDEFLEDYTREEIMDEMIYQKVSDFLYENAKFVEVTEEEYLATQEEAYDEESAGEGAEEIIIDESGEFVEEDVEEADDESEEEASEEAVEDATEEENEDATEAE